MMYKKIGIYKGIEFNISRMDNGMFELYTNDAGSKKIGFVETKYPGIYSLIVNRAEITTAFSITKHARYKGFVFEVMEEDEDKVLISTGDTSVCEKLQMDSIDRWDYRKWVNKTDIEEIWEEKKPIYEFELPE